MHPDHFLCLTPSFIDFSKSLVKRIKNIFTQPELLPAKATFVSELGHQPFQIKIEGTATVLNINTGDVKSSRSGDKPPQNLICPNVSELALYRLL